MPVIRSAAVIDDQREIVDLIAEMLAALGTETITFSSGHPALEYLAANPVDVVVMDLNMPDIDGHELILRVRETLPDTPVLIVSGDLTPQVDLTDSPAVQFLQKPFGLSHLRAALDRLS